MKINLKKSLYLLRTHQYRLLIASLFILTNLTGLSFHAAPVLAQGDLCGPLDVVILIDSTSSMENAINTVKVEANNLVDAVVNASKNASGTPDYQMGLITFNDAIVARHGLAPNSANTIKTVISAVSAIGGIGGPEASDEALNTAVNLLSAAGRPQNADFPGVWRSGATKIIIMITDAPPGGFDDTFVAGVDDVRAHSYAENARDGGIKVSSVYVPTGISVIAENVLRDYANTTGGGFVRTAPNGNGTDRAIQEIIGACGSAIDIVVGDPLAEPVQVPEPITIILFGTGVTGIAGYVSRKRRQQ